MQKQARLTESSEFLSDTLLSNRMQSMKMLARKRARCCVNGTNENPLEIHFIFIAFAISFAAGSPIRLISLSQTTLSTYNRSGDVTIFISSLHFAFRINPPSH